MTATTGTKRMRGEQVALPPIDLYGKKVVESVAKKQRIEKAVSDWQNSTQAETQGSSNPRLITGTQSQANIAILPHEMLYHIFTFFDFKTNNSAKQASRTFLSIGNLFKTTLKDYLYGQALSHAEKLPEAAKVKALGKIFTSLLKINDLESAQIVLEKMPEGIKKSRALCMMAYARAKNNLPFSNEWLLQHIDVTNERVLYTKVTYLLKMADLYALKDREIFFAILNEIKKSQTFQNPLFHDYFVRLRNILDKLDRDSIEAVLTLFAIKDLPYFKSYVLEQEAYSNMGEAQAQAERDFHGYAQLEALGIIAGMQAENNPAEVNETIAKALNLKDTLELNESEKAGFFIDMAYALSQLGPEAELSFLRQIADPQDLFKAYLAFANHYLFLDADRAIAYLYAAYELYKLKMESLSAFLFLIPEKLSRLLHREHAWNLFSEILERESFKLSELSDLHVNEEKAEVLIAAIDKAKKVPIQDFSDNDLEEIALEQIARINPSLALQRSQELAFAPEPTLYKDILLSVANSNIRQALNMVELYLPIQSDTEKNNEILFQRVLLYTSLLAKCGKVMT